MMKGRHGCKPMIIESPLMLERNDQGDKYGQIQSKNLRFSDGQKFLLIDGWQSLLCVIRLIVGLGLFQLAFLDYGKNGTDDVDHTQKYGRRHKGSARKLVEQLLQSVSGVSHAIFYNSHGKSRCFMLVIIVVSSGAGFFRIDIN